MTEEGAELGGLVCSEGAVVGDQLEELRRIAARVSVAGRLKMPAMIAIVSGVGAVTAALRGISAHVPLNYVLLCIGISLVVQGVWALNRPCLRRLAGIGPSLLVMGAWDIFVSVYNNWAFVSRGHSPTMQASYRSSKWFVYGIVAISLGIVELIRYFRYAKAVRGEESAELSAWVDGMVNYIGQSNPQQVCDVVPLYVATWTNRKEPWRAWLGPDVLMVMERRGREIVVARKQDVDIHRGRRNITRSMYQVLLRVHDRKFQALIPCEVLNRLEDWRAGAGEGVAISLEASRGRNGFLWGGLIGLIPAVVVCVPAVAFRSRGTPWYEPAIGFCSIGILLFVIGGLVGKLVQKIFGYRYGSSSL